MRESEGMQALKGLMSMLARDQALAARAYEVLNPLLQRISNGKIRKCRAEMGDVLFSGGVLLKSVGAPLQCTFSGYTMRDPIAIHWDSVFANVLFDKHGDALRGRVSVVDWQAVNDAVDGVLRGTADFCNYDRLIMAVWQDFGGEVASVPGLALCYTVSAACRLLVQAAVSGDVVRCGLLADVVRTFDYCLPLMLRQTPGAAHASPGQTLTIAYR